MQMPVWPGWETVDRIGKGGFGSVYEIQRERFGNIEKNAMKVISLPVDEDEVEMLRAEGVDDVSIAAAVKNQVSLIDQEYNFMKELGDSANVVHCFDIDFKKKDDGIGWNIYIRMELLTPMMKVLDKFKTENHVIRFALDICNGLAACHDANLIHRDIKPQNILFGKGRFKIGDFGIARLATKAGKATTGVGSSAYMAPEVEMGEPYDKTVDIYSLGLVLYWMLNNYRGPFMPEAPVVATYDEASNARRKRILGEKLPAPKNGTPELQRIVLKACAHNPRERYQTAREMMRDLVELRKVRANGPEIPIAVSAALNDTTDPDDIDTLLDIAKSLSAKKDKSRDIKKPVGSKEDPANTSRSVDEDDVRKLPQGSEKEKPASDPVTDDAPKRNKQSHRKGSFGLIAIVAVVAILVGLGIGIGRGKNDSGTLQTVVEDDLSMMVTTSETTLATEAQEVITSETETPAAVPIPVYELVDPLDSEKNILIIHESEDDGDQPDTYMLLSFQRDSKTLVISSILKDAYVTVPEYNGHYFGNTKLEYVFDLGFNLDKNQGADNLLKACLKENFDISVDEIMVTSDKALEAFVDVIGGVNIWISQAEAFNISVVFGGDEEILMNGSTAVRYTKAYVGDSNIFRTGCQRNLMAAIIAKCKKLQVNEIESAIYETDTWLSSRMSSAEIIGYLIESKDYEIKERTYPAEGTYWGEIVDTTGNGNLESVLKFGNKDNLSTPETAVPTAEDIVLELQKEDITIAAGLGIRLMLKNNVDPTTVTWRAKDEDIVSVDERGEIKALKAGTTRVYVEYGNQTDSVIVRVIES